MLSVLQCLHSQYVRMLLCIRNNTWLAIIVRDLMPHTCIVSAGCIGACEAPYSAKLRIHDGNGLQFRRGHIVDSVSVISVCIIIAISSPWLVVYTSSSDRLASPGHYSIIWSPWWSINHSVYHITCKIKYFIAKPPVSDLVATAAALSPWVRKSRRRAAPSIHHRSCNLSGIYTASILAAALW